MNLGGDTLHNGSKGHWYDCGDTFWEAPEERRERVASRGDPGAREERAQTDSRCGVTLESPWKLPSGRSSLYRL